MSFDRFVALMLDPGHLLTHIPYALLVISMLMNDMGWLRAIAIVAGVVRIINRSFFAIDPIIVFWEVIFVAVNVVQLMILLYYRRRHDMSDDERRFATTIANDVEGSTVRRLLRLAELRHAAPDSTLTVEGKPVDELLFLAEGVAQIERNGRIVAVCGPGDFVGEMSFISGAPATATARVMKPARYFAFDQKRLRAAMAADTDLRRALESGFNRNLSDKLAKASAAPA
ncbi:MAG TPA: cyclic nucleotide-binding domain-containing protein [Devosia sp.]|nr:cyclic nucleotide-binding domain-containing protein [Devosia sp.]